MMAQDFFEPNDPDFMDLAQRRTRTFPVTKILMVSTPTGKESLFTSEMMPTGGWVVVFKRLDQQAISGGNTQ